MSSADSEGSPAEFSAESPGSEAVPGSTGPRAGSAAAPAESPRSQDEPSDVAALADVRVPRIAVVPAYNEEPTVAAILDRLYLEVDELVVVDDGSTDGTRAAIVSWLPGHERARLLAFDANRGMSAAYYEAFRHLAERVRVGELSADALICTVDADGQHDPHALDELVDVAEHEHADAVIARRDLSGYPPYKRLGNELLSRWATYWARSPLPDVESGFRVFRAGALADALQYYRGYKYSETVEVAVILCRLGYTVRNDVVQPVPVIRSRTRMSDAVIDVVMIVVAARRAERRHVLGRAARAPLPAVAPSWD